MTQVVQVKRGRYSSGYQVARAFLSASSAVINTDRERAVTLIDEAIAELKKLKASLKKAS